MSFKKQRQERLCDQSNVYTNNAILVTSELAALFANFTLVVVVILVIVVTYGLTAPDRYCQQYKVLERSSNLQQ